RRDLPRPRAPARGGPHAPRRAAPARCARAAPALQGRSARSRRARARRPSLLEALADRPTEGDLSVIDAYVEPAFRVSADPRLVRNRRPVATVVRQRDQETLLTLPAGGPFFHVLHAAPPFARSDPRYPPSTPGQR